MKKIILTVTIILLTVIPQSMTAQTGKKALDHDAIESWKRITETVISPDGKYIAYKTDPWRGDTELFLYRQNGDRIKAFNCGSSASFTFDSKFVVFDILPAYNVIKELTLKKTKKEDMPLKSTVIYNLAGAREMRIERTRSLSVPAEWSGIIAYQVEPAAGNGGARERKPEGESSGNDTKPAATKKESSKNGYSLYLFNPERGDTVTYPFVTSYSLARKSPGVIFASTGDENGFEHGIYHYNPSTGNLSILYSGKADFKQVTISDDAARAAFLVNPDEDGKDNDFSLYYWNGNGQASLLADNSISGLPENWRISENGRLQFSDNMKRIFLGTAPVMPEKDTMRYDDEYPNVDIWLGTEGKLHTVQVVDKNRDMRRTWMAMVDPSNSRFMQLATPEIPDISLIDEGNSDWVMASSNMPYELQTMWEGSPEHIDLYLINIASGEKKVIRKDVRVTPMTSPGGKYISWYDYITESLYTYNIATGVEKMVTSPDKVMMAQEVNDIPNPASPYRPTGWMSDDSKILVNDRYDIWMVDPEGVASPVNLTVNGRTTLTSYNNITFDRDKKFFSSGEELLLAGQNDITRESAYYSFKLGAPNAPRKLIGGPFSLSTPDKAKNASTVVYTKETFGIFPDLLVSDLTFKKSVKISDANPQQAEYIWGTAELYKWTSLDGIEIEGLLYKPADFDPSKKYPMIVNFYEKSSSELFSHRIPELHRSTIDYHYYTSNGYIVFNPDVYYEDGYPGESAFNCVMPGITSLIAEGYVDKDHIGAQGHSWGGYQVAYLATRTDLFAAIESGAPVVNMFSAYGGIRWASGLNRSFQYEHTQSRIGATIWESPLRYLENSPLFTMDKVTTPILIMHNDSDGHVPWYQGIEYFIALRRLQKPVWMLNYTGEPHWPTNLKNKKDFQIRLSQFFDHFLKEKPMPEWMSNGIPVIMKEYDLGYKRPEK